MRRTCIAIAILGLFGLLALPALAEDSNKLAKIHDFVPKDFARPYPTIPGPVIPAPPALPPVSPNPGGNPVPQGGKMTGEQRILQGADGSTRAGQSDLMHSMDGQAGYGFLGRGGGAAHSPVQDARHGIKRLIRSLG